MVPPDWARLFYGDVPMWALRVFAPGTMAALAGVPRNLPMTDDDARFVREFVDSMFPIASKIQGVVFDAYVSNAGVNGYSLEAISVPTLLVHAKDDPLASYDAAERAAGGASRVRAWSASYLAATSS